jgi:hypothetical protein
MTGLVWNELSDRFFETGLDRGVFYPKVVKTPVIVDRNEAFNPRAAAGANGWATDAGTGGVTTSVDVANGGWQNFSYRKATWTTAPTAGNCRIRVNPSQIPVVAGEVLSIGIHGMASVAKNHRLSIDFYNGATFVTSTSTTSTPATPDVWQFYAKENIIVPPTTTNIRIYFSRSTFADIVAGEYIAATGLIVVRDSKLPDLPENYFDGSWTDNSNHYEWEGAVNASTSVRRLITGTAIPWNGLTGVDEGGADGASSYYIDGRPFLYLPKPKEYTATLKAYTYPEEFAEIMGVTEAADGMYLDSQQGDAFDLSYRTLVGNGIDGIDHGYKIHLVYNATVTPQGASFASLTNSINPIEFTWQIQAVPVPVEGYRPTAHIIIDTRRIDPDKLAAIETLLYGGPYSAPLMPAPQQIFDILSYGDTIIITDNGDGTWSAQGSYQNIYMIGDGIFEIDNANATDHGDGTFTISSSV